MPEKPTALSPVDEALAQYEFLRLRERDAEFVADGGRLLYAIDANIVLFLLDPARHALPGGQRRLGYAGIFADDPEDAAELLAGALAEFIETISDNETPLLLIPPIDGWTYSQAHALIRKSTDTIDTEARAEATRFIAALPTDDGNRVFGDEDLARQEEIAARIARLVYLESGAPAELRRFEALTGDPPRLLSVSEIDQHPRFPPALHRDRRNEPSDKLDHSFRWSRWLTAFSRVSNRGEAAEMPAHAMAYLERWNLRLERPKVRILFITGDSLLLEAGKVVDADLPRGADGNFTELFLRHPRCFLPELPFLQLPGETTGTQNITHFFDVWPHPRRLAPNGGSSVAIVDRVQNQERIRDIIEKDLGTDLRDRWRGLMSSAAAQFRAGGRLLEPHAEWQQDAAESLRAWQERLKSELDRRVEKMWESCFRVATRAHLVFGTAGIRTSPRIAPRLFIDGWPKAEELIGDLARLNSAASFDFGAYEAKLKEIEQEVRTARQDDPDGGEGGYRYAYYLVHGSLFAGRSEWRVAANVAAYAFERRIPVATLTPDGVNGREARYLEAVCRRFDARGCEDLEAPRRLLQEARNIARQEDADCVIERFDVEECAIDYTRAMFRIFLPKPGAAPWRKEEFTALATKLHAARDMIDRSLRKLEAGDVRRKSILRTLAIRTAVNIVSLALLDPSGSGPVDARALDLLRENHTSGNLHNVGRAVLACAEARIAERGAPAERRARQELERLLPEGRGWEDFVELPYDRPRIARMRDNALGRALPS